MVSYPGPEGAPAHSPSPPGSSSQRDERAKTPPEECPGKWYKVIITAVNFTSFLVSLLVVDIRYSLRRTRYHTEVPSWLPSWTHGLLYRSKPPKDVYRTKKGPGHTGRGEETYYHSNQKKLMRMEAEEAFRVRNTVMALAFSVVIIFIGLSWMALKHMWRHWIMGRGG